MALFFCGYFDAHNAGDDWLLEASLNLCATLFPEKKVLILGQSSRTGPVPNSRFINRYNPLAVLNALRKCSALVVPGGSLFQDQSSARSFLYYYTLVRTAKRFGKPVHLIAQGIEPFQHTRTERLFKQLIHSCDHISVRDAASQDYLYSLGAESQLRADLALATLSAFPEATLAPIKPDIGVAFRSSSFPAAIRTAMTQIQPKWALAMQRPHDRVTTREIYGSKTPELIEFQHISDPAPTPISMLVTNRYHAALWAMVQGIPFCVIAQPYTKCFTLAKECGQAVINPSDPTHTRESVLAFILARRNDTAKYQKTLIENRKALLERATHIRKDVAAWI
ncbi:MAG: polysaccharide pyruvyl transferase family protein [bacterium]|nr:polysaccharide pyruvyl transferase family protein [bacterium]